MKRIIYVSLDDEKDGESWEAIYVDGNLISQNHSLDLFYELSCREDTKDIKINEVFPVSISARQIEKYGCQCPSKLPPAWKRKA